MEVVEYRRSSSAKALGLCRSRSVRSSLRLFGARWRTGSVCAASKEHFSQETNQRSAVTVLGASTVPGQRTQPPPSTAASQQQKKQKGSRIPWLTVFSHLQKNHLKSPFASVGKRNTKQCNAKLVSSELPECEETVPEYRSSKASWILGLREEKAQWTKSSSLQFLAEQPNRQFKVSLPQLNAKGSGSLRRSPSPVELCHQEEPHFVPLVSSVGTQRRNSMWALGASNPSTLRFMFIWLIRYQRSSLTVS
jgi:hypothetical protein